MGASPSTAGAAAAAVDATAALPYDHSDAHAGAGDDAAIAAKAVQKIAGAKSPPVALMPSSARATLSTSSSSSSSSTSSSTLPSSP